MKDKNFIKFIPFIIGGILIIGFLGVEIYFNKPATKNNILSGTILYPSGGGLGTSTNPIYGQIPVGNSGSTYTLTATSSLGITASQVYPGAGIALSTGSAWDTSITNNSGNWNTAYTNASTSLYSLFVNRNSWTTIDDYPAACSGGQYVSAIGDTLTCATPAGGSGVGTVSTSTTPTIGQLSYWTGIGWPSTLGTVATTTLTENSLALSLSQPISVIGSSASILSLSTSTLFSYPWTVADGGTGSTTLSGILKGAGTSAVATAVNGTDYTLLTAQSCTNQVVTALTAIGGSTCSSVSNAMLSNSTISGVALGGSLAALTNDATLSGSSYNGSGAISDWGLNLANANTWTGLQTFNNATTTLLSASYASSTLGYFGTAYIPTLGTAAGTFLAVNANGQIIATSTPSGSGTVTSVGLAVPIGLTVSGTNPITTSGTFTLAYNIQQTYIPFGGVAGVIATSTAFVFDTSLSKLTVTYASSTAITMNYASSTIGNFGTLTAGASTLNGVIDAGGAVSFELPNSTDPTVDATGEIAVNTTAASSSIRFYNGTAERALSDIISRTITVASTTLWNATATTTIPIGVSMRGETWIRTACFSDIGTAAVQFGNGTASSSYISVSTTLANTTQTNTFSLYQKRYMDIGKLASSPNYISCSIYYRETAD